MGGYVINILASQKLNIIGNFSAIYLVYLVARVSLATHFQRFYLLCNPSGNGGRSSLVSFQGRTLERDKTKH
jgi:hypothetical protein